MRRQDVRKAETCVSGRGTTRREFLGYSAVLAAAAVLPGTVGACGRSAVDVKNLQWGIPPGVDNISPNIWTGVGVTIAHMGLESLLQVNEKGELEPWLAEKYENRENREFVLTLRENLRWSDGSPLTIDDVLFQYEYNLKEKGQPLYGYFPGFGVAGVEKTGPRQITVYADTPNPRIGPGILASQATWLVKPDILKRYGYDKMGSPDALPIGSGPYVFEEFVPDSSIRVRRNRHYWAWDRLGLVPETLHIRVYKETSTLLLGAVNGEISGSHYVGCVDLPEYERVAGYSTYATPDMTTCLFALNTKVKPFNDVHCRRALAYALDRESLVTAVWGGYAKAATSLVPPQDWRGFLSSNEVEDMNKHLPNYSFDLARASQELKMSSHPNGFSLTVLTSDAQPEQSKVCQVFARDLQKIGVTLNVKVVSENQYFDPLYKNDPTDPNHVISIGYSSFEYYDPVLPFDDHYSTRNAKEGLTNWSFFSNDRMDELLKLQASETDSPVRGRYFSEMLRIAQEEEPYIAVVWPEIGAVTDTGIQYRNFNANMFLNGVPWPTGLLKA